MTNKLASNDASLIWNSYYTKKFHSEVIQDLHFMSPKKSANKQDPLKLLILLQNRIVIIDVQTDTIVSELSPLTEGTLQKTLLFNNNTEAVTYNFVSEEQQNQLMWIDLKKEEPKWTEYVQGIKQIFKIGVEHFAMALEVDNSNKKASMVLLCSTKGLAMKEYSLFTTQIQHFWVTYATNKTYLYGLDSSSDLYMLDINVTNNFQLEESDQGDMETENVDLDNNEVSGAINFDGRGTWDQNETEDFFAVYKSRHTNPMKIENLFYEKSHLMPNLNMLAEQNFDGLLISNHSQNPTETE